jgi:hypothetical protein
LRTDLIPTAIVEPSAFPEASLLVKRVRFCALVGRGFGFGTVKVPVMKTVGTRSLSRRDPTLPQIRYEVTQDSAATFANQLGLVLVFVSLDDRRVTAYQTAEGSNGGLHEHRPDS